MIEQNEIKTDCKTGILDGVEVEKYLIFANAHPGQRVKMSGVDYDIDGIVTRVERSLEQKGHAGEPLWSYEVVLHIDGAPVYWMTLHPSQSVAIWKLHRGNYPKHDSIKAVSGAE